MSKVLNPNTSLLIILHHLIRKELQFDAGLAEHLFGLLSGVVFVGADHADDAAVDDEHGAGAAGSHAAVEGGAVEGDAQLGGLADGVLLGVDGAHAVLGDGAVFVNHLFELVAHLIAMRETFGRAHIAGDEDLAVAHHHTAAAPAVAGGTFAHCISDFHKVFVPRRTRMMFFFHNEFLSKKEAAKVHILPIVSINFHLQKAVENAPFW